MRPSSVVLRSGCDERLNLRASTKHNTSPLSSSSASPARPRSGLAGACKHLPRATGTALS